MTPPQDPAPDIAADVRKKVLAALRQLHGVPGSVRIEIHCDSTGPRKVIAVIEESWRVGSA